MKLILSTLLLVVVTSCAVTTATALGNVPEFVIDPNALEQCLELRNAPAKGVDYHRADYYNHNCSLVCEYLESVKHGSACGRGGCSFIWTTNETRLQYFTVNEGQPCESKGVCHDGLCHDADSQRGYVTTTINSVELNAKVYTKDTFAECNTDDGEPGNSAVTVCIDSQNRNVTALKQMNGFMYPQDYPSTDKMFPNPADTCDLLFCYFWLPTLDPSNLDVKRVAPFKCLYGSRTIHTSHSVNFMFQKFAYSCIMDVIQIPLRELVQDHGKRPTRMLQFAHIGVPINVTLEWNGIIP